MTYYIAADEHTLVIAAFNRPPLRLPLKKHLFAKGLTKAQASIHLLEYLSGFGEYGRVPWWQSIKQLLRQDYKIGGLFFNDPPRNEPIVHSRLYSLNSTDVEIWLRKVFGEYRNCLPPIVNALQQEYENWLGDRWRTNSNIPSEPLVQASLAAEVHEGMGQVMREKRERIQQQAQEHQQPKEELWQLQNSR